MVAAEGGGGLEGPDVDELDVAVAASQGEQAAVGAGDAGHDERVEGRQLFAPQALAVRRTPCVQHPVRRDYNQ